MLEGNKRQHYIVLSPGVVGGESEERKQEPAADPTPSIGLEAMRAWGVQLMIYDDM